MSAGAPRAPRAAPRPCSDARDVRPAPAPARAPPGPRAPSPRSSDASSRRGPSRIRRQGHQVLLARVPARGLADAPPDVRPTSGITRGHGPAPRPSPPPRARARVGPPSFADRSAGDAAPAAAATPARTTPAPSIDPSATRARARPSPCRVPTSPRRVGALVEYETSSRRFARSPRRERGRGARPARLSRARGPPPLASGR